MKDAANLKQFCAQEIWEKLVKSLDKCKGYSLKEVKVKLRSRSEL